MPQTAPSSIHLPEHLTLEGLNPFSPHDECLSSASDNEYQHALEVVFNAENAHRRKSSLIASETPANIFHRRKNTECFVHALLESQQRNGGGKEDRGGLETIAETLANRRVGSAVDGKDDGVVGGKGARGEENEVPNGNGDGSGNRSENEGMGQEDEQAWKSRMENHLPPTTSTSTSSMSELAAKKPSDDSSQYVAVTAEENFTHSRLLTKKQLSDMAWGVRELSKRLGSIRLKLKVKTVFLLTKAHDENLIGNTREVARWLLSSEREVRYTVWVEENLRENKKFDEKGLIEGLKKEYIEKEEGKGGDAGGLEKRLRYWKNDMCKTRPHSFDFVVTLGGDGTVLYASWLFQRIVPPVLSFALGSLGFLTKFDYEMFRETLERSFRDGVTISLRLRFEGTVMRSQKKKRRITNGDVNSDGEGDEEGMRDLVEELVGEEKEDERTHRPDGSFEILNDIVVDRGPNPTMSSIEIFGDDEHFTSVQADGICVSTPTGSTAYSLAAGGSLCHPENPVILVTAICAHTLSFRPIILPDTIVLRVGVPYDARTSSWASFDGRERVELRPGDYVTISASRYPFANVMPQGRRSEDWIQSISGKLGWNTRQRQKSFKEWSK